MGRLRGGGWGDQPRGLARSRGEEREEGDIDIPGAAAVVVVRPASSSFSSATASRDMPRATRHQRQHQAARVPPRRHRSPPPTSAPPSPKQATPRRREHTARSGVRVRSLVRSLARVRAQPRRRVGSGGRARASRGHPTARARTRTLARGARRAARQRRRRPPPFPTRPARGSLVGPLIEVM